MAFEFEEQRIPGVYVIRPKVFGDNRGYFVETYKREEFETAGIKGEFVQDNESSSSKGVLRGLHFQKDHTQGKLVRVTEGRVYDVAVDVRPGSEFFGQYVGVELSSEEKNMFFIPAGFAHGFLVLSDKATFTYKCTDVYDHSSEGGIPWNDPDIGIDWPKLDVEFKTSEKDGKHPGFKEQSFDWAKKWV
ncbi:MAG: dTDP-4-dehydrorhamnose 3,5-epimerase [Lachnospiraceae bacterium]|nr:dTDP-4-dehydrorhamnose 3,5-epimerase [Lachnospiraceae bacterium]